MSVQSFILRNYRSARTQSHCDMINKKKEKHRRIYSRQQSASHAKRKQKLKEVPCKLTPYRLAKHSAAEAEEPTRGRYPADGTCPLCRHHVAANHVQPWIHTAHIDVLRVGHREPQSNQLVIKSF